MPVCVVSLDTLRRWQVKVSVYCARRISAHLKFPRVQSCYTLSISASQLVFVCGRYRKTRLACVW